MLRNQITWTRFDAHLDHEHADEQTGPRHPADSCSGGSLIQNGSTVTGYEGNGVLQFQGTYTSIAFTTPNYEFYYGATVGSPLVAAVPEPQTYAMLLAGLGLLGWVARRRQA